MVFYLVNIGFAPAFCPEPLDQSALETGVFGDS